MSSPVLLTSYVCPVHALCYPFDVVCCPCPVTSAIVLRRSSAVRRADDTIAVVRWSARPSPAGHYSWVYGDLPPNTAAAAAGGFLLFRPGGLLWHVPPLCERRVTEPRGDDTGGGDYKPRRKRESRRRLVTFASAARGPSPAIVNNFLGVGDKRVLPHDRDRVHTPQDVPYVFFWGKPIVERTLGLTQTIFRPSLSCRWFPLAMEGKCGHAPL